MSTENGEQQTTIGHLFSEETAPPPVETPAAVEQPAQQPVEATQQPQAQTTAPEAAQPAQQPHTVPLAELIDTRKRAQAAEDMARRQQQQIDQLNESMRRLQQPQQQPQPIDPVTDPEAFVSHVTNVIEQRFQQQAIGASMQRAIEKHGADFVNEAANAAHQQGLDGYFASRPDPHAEAIAWYRGQKLQSEIGTDPSAYRQNLEAELRAKILAEMKQGTPPPSNLPPSLSTTTRVNGATEPIPDGRDFFNSMMNQRSR